jgi:hypothetical protein
MAKKDKKKSKKKDNPGADAVGAVRSAVEKTFQATADSAQSTRTRAQDLVDEVASASKRVREMIEQIGVLEDLKKQVDALSSRVAALEKSGSSTPARRSTASRSTASRSKPATAAAKKPAARKPAARKPAARKPAASRSASSSRSTASRSTAAKSTGTTRKTTRSSPAKS